MSAPRRELELNAAARRRKVREFRQHLVTASNELYLHALLCEQEGRPFPPSLGRAHAAIRAEVRRLEAEERRGDGVTPGPGGRAGLPRSRPE